METKVIETTTMNPEETVNISYTNESIGENQTVEHKCCCCHENVKVDFGKKDENTTIQDHAVSVKVS